MLGKRELRIKLSKPDKNDNDQSTPLDDVLNPDTVALIEDAGKRVVKYIALTVGALVIAVKAADTMSQVIVKKTKSADQK